jgi:hypothetical protein
MKTFPSWRWVAAALALVLCTSANAQAPTSSPKASSPLPTLNSQTLPAKPARPAGTADIGNLDLLLQSETQQRIQTNQAICDSLPNLPSCLSGALRKPALSPQQTPKLTFRKSASGVPIIDNEASGGIRDICLINPKHPICIRKVDK